MKRYRLLSPSTLPAGRWVSALALAALSLTACRGDITEPPSSSSTGTGAGPGGGGGGGGGTSGALQCTTPATITLAVGSLPAAGAPQRLVRLTLAQATNSLKTLLNPTAADTIATQIGVGDPAQNTFPVLNGPREGVSIIPSLFTKTDGIAAAAGQYVFDNYAATTGCTEATPTDACAQSFLMSFAEKAYRRPLTSTEQASLTQVYTEVKAAGGTVQEGAQYGVYAALSTPQFLYRSEVGDLTRKTADGVPLTPYEEATQLAFFLSDGPPDQALLDAAQQNHLGTTAEIGAQVDRLLALPAVQDNLSSAIFTYFKLNLLDNVVIDPLKVPEYTTGLQNAMYTEGQRFLSSTLWGGTIADLLTSRETTLNADLATLIYKMTPPTGATTTNFVTATVPENRAGILTLPAFITSRARTDVGSVVARGLVVDETIMCQVIPGPPADLADKIAMAKSMLANQTDKQAAEYRDTTVPCNGCHANFDPYGLVLDNYDVIGRFRTVDDQGRPVDATTPLPPALGSGSVANAVEMAQTLAQNGAFTNCMTKSVLQYAMADVTSAPVDLNSCAVQTLERQLATTNQPPTFAALVRAVAVSKSMTFRTQGGN